MLDIKQLFQLILIKYIIQMFSNTGDDFLEMLMSGKGEEYLDREIGKLREEIGEQQFQQFADEYFKKERTQNIYASTQNKLEIEKRKQDEDKYFTQQPEDKEKIFLTNLNSIEEQIVEGSNEREVSEAQMATCEEEKQLLEISRELIEGTNKYCIMYNNGDKYIGEVEGSSKNGWGTYLFSNGEKYDGCFILDQIHGYGHYFFVSGAEYEGDWSSGMKHGIGILKFANKDIYEGMFCRDQFHGNGTFRYHCGDIYEGQWKKGKKHGKGKFQGVDGRLMIGKWIEGQFTVD